jgi:hypothetical protein
VRSLGYDGAHHATSDGWDPIQSGFGYSGGLLSQVNQGAGSWTIVSAAAATGADDAVGDAAAPVKDGLNHTTSVRARRITG